MTTLLVRGWHGAPARMNLELRQGDTLLLPFAVVYGTGEDQRAVNLTDCTITFGLKDRVSGQVVLTQAAEVENAESGYFRVRLESTQTANLSGDYEYEIEMEWAVGSIEWPDGFTKTVLVGSLRVTEDIVE